MLRCQPKRLTYLRKSGYKCCSVLERHRLNAKLSGHITQAEVQTENQMPTCVTGRGDKRSFTKGKITLYWIACSSNVALMLLHTKSGVKDSESLQHLLCTYYVPNTLSI